MRTTSPALSAAFTEGVLSRGADVVDIGLASTDGLWFASGSLGLPGAMFTASHNPGSYNGIKFCHPGAQPVEPAELVAIRDRALADGPEAQTPERRPSGPAPGPSGTCSGRTRTTCCPWSTCRASAGSRSSSTPATGWAA